VPMSGRAAAAGYALERGADIQQAEYFVALLDRRKAEVCELLELHLDALARFQRVGDLAGLRRKRRVVRTFESELGSIDGMLHALRVRLGWPTLPRTM
jgi:hypothetical protein